MIRNESLEKFQKRIYGWSSVPLPKTVGGLKSGGDTHIDTWGHNESDFTITTRLGRVGGWEDHVYGRDILQRPPIGLGPSPIGQPIRIDWRPPPKC